MNVAIISGETSGDLIGGALARELNLASPNLEIWGLGSDSMRAAGVEILADSAGWGVISITQAIQKYPELRFKVLPLVLKALRTRRPDVVVLIDFGAFNKRVAQEATRLGLKVCWYFPPGAAWRKTGNKGANLAAITDLLVVPFEWSAERLRKLGANAVNVGHPVIERTITGIGRPEFAALFGLDPAKPIIGLLPGSRLHEIEHLMPVLLEAACIIQGQVKDAQFVIGLAPGIDRERISRYLTSDVSLRKRLSEAWIEFVREAETRVIRPVTSTANLLTGKRERRLVTVEGLIVPEDSLIRLEALRSRKGAMAASGKGLPPVVIVKGATSELMAHSDVLLTCSGTATLEAAAFETPMVILYRFSKLMELEARLLGLKKKIKMIGLPNILAEKKFIPELIQYDANPENIASHALSLLNDFSARAEMKQELHKIREMMGEPGASARTAKLVLELANRK